VDIIVQKIEPIVQQDVGTTCERFLSERGGEERTGTAPPVDGGPGSVLPANGDGPQEHHTRYVHGVTG
jgi:hypothetical protein